MTGEHVLTRTESESYLRLCCQLSQQVGVPNEPLIRLQQSHTAEKCFNVQTKLGKTNTETH